MSRETMVGAKVKGHLVYVNVLRKFLFWRLIAYSHVVKFAHGRTIKNVKTKWILKWGIFMKEADHVKS